MERRVFIVYTHSGLNINIVCFYEKCLKVCFDADVEKYPPCADVKLEYLFDLIIL